MVPGVFENAPLMHRHQRDRLGDIERRAAAESDDAVGAMCAIRIRPRLYLRCDRIALDACKETGIQSGKVGTKF